jgi:sulfur relay (sulfurtransferase) complex TusBCD TusD component (DsrE family)
VKLGIIITTDRHLDHVIGITQTANAKGHEVSIFAMDSGTCLLGYPEFTQLCTAENVVISLCQHSASEHGVDTEGVSKEIVLGSQFNNAMMNNEADKVISL